MSDPLVSTELLYAMGDVRLGDVVRVPGREEWCVVVGLEDGGPDGVRQVGPVSLEITVSEEALRRAMMGEFPDPVLVLCPIAKGGRRRSSGPVERMLDAGRWLRLQPSSTLVTASVALQTVASDDFSLGAVRARLALTEAAVEGLAGPERRGRKF